MIVGVILDKYGPRICCYIGSFFLLAGSILLAFANTMSLLDAYVVGYMCLAFGGPFIFISSFQLSNAFPSNSGLILAILTGAFDSSTGVYLIYRIIYDESNGRFHPKEFFLLYIIVPVFIFVASITIMPKNSYKPGTNLMDAIVRGKEVNSKMVPAEFDDSSSENDATLVLSNDTVSRGHRLLYASDDDVDEQYYDDSRTLAKSQAKNVKDPDERTALLSDEERLLSAEEIDEYDAEEMEKLKISGVWGVLHGKTAMEQIRTPWFVLLCLFTIIQMLRLNYFVASIRAQYEFLFDNPQIARRINEFFDVALPAGGVISIPISGYLLDRHSTATGWTVLLIMGTAFGILGNIGSVYTAYANVCIFVLYRSMFYTAASDYSGKVFGYDTFGKVYGLISTISGVFNFAQSGFDNVTHRVFSRDPRPVNVAILILSFSIGTLFVYFITAQAKKIKRSALELEAEHAPLIRMPGYLDE